MHFVVFPVVIFGFHRFPADISQKKVGVMRSEMFGVRDMFGVGCLSCFLALFHLRGASISRKTTSGLEFTREMFSHSAFQ